MVTEILGALIGAIIAVIGALTFGQYHNYECNLKGGKQCADECILPGKTPKVRRWYNGDVLSQEWYKACAENRPCLENCYLNEGE